MLGDDDDAFHWLEKAIQLGNENLPWFESNPFWRRLRDHPRFVELMTTLHEKRKLRHLTGQDVIGADEKGV